MAATGLYCGESREVTGSQVCHERSRNRTRIAVGRRGRRWSRARRPWSRAAGACRRGRRRRPRAAGRGSAAAIICSHAGLPAGRLRPGGVRRALDDVGGAAAHRGPKQAAVEERRRMAMERYGLVPASRRSVAVAAIRRRRRTGRWTMSCLACHQGQVAGRGDPGRCPTPTTPSRRSPRRCGS